MDVCAADNINNKETSIANSIRAGNEMRKTYPFHCCYHEGDDNYLLDCSD